MIVPKPGDLYAALDACKSADSVIFLISPASDNESFISDKTSSNEGALGFDAVGEQLLSAIMAQGLPSPIFLLNDIDIVPLKKCGDYKKMLQKQLDRMVPVEKLQVLETEGDALRLLHQIGSQKSDPDPINGEQTWPYQEEMEGENHEIMENEGEESEKKKRLPKGTSEYQAAWLDKEEGGISNLHDFFHSNSNNQFY